MLWPHRPSLCATACLLGVLCGAAAPTASAQVRRRSVVNRHGEAGLIELPRATLIDEGRFAFGTWVDFFHHDGKQGLRPAPVAMGFGLPFDLEASFAIAGRSGGDPALRDELVQLRTTVKHRLLAEPKRPLALALGLRLENLLGTPELSPLLLVDKAFNGLAVAAAAGYRFAAGDGASSALNVGVGAEYQIAPWLLVQAESIAQYHPDPGLSFEATGALRLKLFASLDLVVGAGGGVGDLSSSLRVSLGLVFRPSGSPNLDSDGDTVPDARDLCPDQKEDLDGFQDEDGCPEPGELGAERASAHRGPVRLRLAIPPQPVPTWIMRVPDQPTAAAPAGPLDGARLRAARRREVDANVLGLTVGLRLRLRLPRWILADDAKPKVPRPDVPGQEGQR